VYKEMWLAGIKSENALKAQAVAARNYAVKNMKRHSSEEYNLCNRTHCQVWLPEPFVGYPSKIKTAVNNTSGIGATLNGSVINTTYFSSSRNHYTRNSEDAPGFGGYYCHYLRKTITPEDTSVGAGGHGAGMSQYGAKKLADDGVGYENILKHYYGPVPPSENLKKREVMR
jgi:peptidoglycan hydrolase-like amidase